MPSDRPVPAGMPRGWLQLELVHQFSKDPATEELTTNVMDKPDLFLLLKRRYPEVTDAQYRAGLRRMVFGVVGFRRVMNKQLQELLAAKMTQYGKRKWEFQYQIDHFQQHPPSPFRGNNTNAIKVESGLERTGSNEEDTKPPPLTLPLDARVERQRKWSSFEPTTAATTSSSGEAPTAPNNPYNPNTSSVELVQDDEALPWKLEAGDLWDHDPALTGNHNPGCAQHSTPNHRVGDYSWHQDTTKIATPTNNVPTTHPHQVICDDDDVLMTDFTVQIMDPVLSSGTHSHDQMVVHSPASISKRPLHRGTGGVLAPQLVMTSSIETPAFRDSIGSPKQFFGGNPIGFANAPSPALFLSSPSPLRPSAPNQPKHSFAAVKDMSNLRWVISDPELAIKDIISDTHRSEMYIDRFDLHDMVISDFLKTAATRMVYHTPPPSTTGREDWELGMMQQVKQFCCPQGAFAVLPIPHANAPVLYSEEKVFHMMGANVMQTFWRHMYCDDVVRMFMANRSRRTPTTLRSYVESQTWQPTVLGISMDRLEGYTVCIGHGCRCRPFIPTEPVVYVDMVYVNSAKEGRIFVWFAPSPTAPVEDRMEEG